MIAAYGMTRFASDALALLAEMKTHGLKPNPVTMLSVLSAYSHGGLVDKGLSFLEELVQDHATDLGIEHYSCMVDLFGWAGKLDNAMDFIKKVPERLKPGASAWEALLSACRSHGNSEFGAGAASLVLELEPSDLAGYLLALSMYAAVGLWNDAARMRWLVKERGVGVVAAYSLVNVDFKACKFLAGDKYHPFRDDIFLTVEQLHSWIKLDERNIEAVFAW